MTTGDVQTCAPFPRPSGLVHRVGGLRGRRPDGRPARCEPGVGGPDPQRSPPPTPSIAAERPRKGPPDLTAARSSRFSAPPGWSPRSPAVARAGERSPPAAMSRAGPHRLRAPATACRRAVLRRGIERCLIPVTVDDLAATGLLVEPAPPDAGSVTVERLPRSRAISPGWPCHSPDRNRGLGAVCRLRRGPDSRLSRCAR